MLDGESVHVDFGEDCDEISPTRQCSSPFVLQRTKCQTSIGNVRCQLVYIVNDAILYLGRIFEE